MIVYDREQKQIVIPNGLGNVNIVINQGCDDDKPTPPQDGWGMTGYFNNWGGTPDIPFEEDGELDGRSYKVIRNFEATGGEFKIRRNNAWTDSYTATLRNIPQFAKLIKGDSNMSINDGVWDIYLFFGDDGVPNEMLVLNPGTDLSTIQYEYTLNLSADKESAVFLIGDGFDYSAKNYYGGNATIPMKYGCIYSINVYMEGYEDIYEDITCYNDEERSYTLTKIEGYGCNLINPIVFSKDAGNTINVENVQIPAFVYEGNQYYNVESFNLADIEDFKIHILFKPNNSGDAEPINVFGCEDTDWDDTTFGARIHQGWIYFRMSGQDVEYQYTENTWYDVEMGYNTTKRWVIVNGETLLDEEYASFNRPSQTLMIGAINSGGNAFRPFYGKIAAIYVEPNGGQVWLLPKENGSMNVYWNNRINSRNSISGENNARFENDYISGDGMKSITWLGNLEDKWVTPSMSERDDNGYIVVSPSEGYNGLKRTVINPQTLYNEGYGQGKTDGVNEQKSKLETISITENGTYTKEDGYNHIEVNVPDLNGSYDEGYAQGKTDGINEQKGKLESISITENGTYTKEDGYNHIEVNVPDLNGSYNEGYEQGQADAVANAKALEVTENGQYGDGKTLYKTINVNVNAISKINVKEAGLKFGYSTFTEVPEWADFNGVTDMEGMFVYCTNLQTIPLIDTSNVTAMMNTFAWCINLQTIPEIDTRNVTDMRYMFYECSNLQTIPQIDTSNVTNMWHMFDNCRNLQTIPILNTSNVTDMSYMFYACNKLQRMPPILNTSNVTDMSFMFYGCQKLQEIPSLNTSKVTNMNNMFVNCYSLDRIPALNAQSLNMGSSLNDGIFGNNDLPNLIDFGGFLNLKCSLTGDNNLKRLPNLINASCIDILDGLYDFTGNGETPNIGQGKLTVHQNFLNEVGDEISIATSKGWVVSAE